MLLMLCFKQQLFPLIDLSANNTEEQPTATSVSEILTYDDCCCDDDDGGGDGGGVLNDAGLSQ